MKISTHCPICRCRKLPQSSIVAYREDKCARSVLAHVAVHIARVRSTNGRQVISGEVQHTEASCCTLGKDHTGLGAPSSGNEIVVAEK
ncbi:hypothetical protein D3C87_1868070 [compost metagenome]